MFVLVIIILVVGKVDFVRVRFCIYLVFWFIVWTLLLFCGIIGDVIGFVVCGLLVIDLVRDIDFCELRVNVGVFIMIVFKLFCNILFFLVSFFLGILLEM